MKFDFREEYQRIRRSFPYMSGKVGEEFSKNCLCRSAGRGALRIRANRLGSGSRAVGPDRALILQGKRGDTVLGTGDMAGSQQGRRGEGGKTGKLRLRSPSCRCHPGLLTLPTNTLC